VSAEIPSDLPPAPPKALLVVSAHWEAPVPTVMTSPHPPMLYDYSGFPPEAYQITGPAPSRRRLSYKLTKR
jgi:aromatic ring-opening dioxygenase catalytic subunit (LigB family)